MARRATFKLFPFFFLTFLLLAVDQLSKEWALQALTPYTSVPFIGDLLKLNLVWNDAAAFSIGFGATWIFTIISSVASVAVLVLVIRTQDFTWKLTLSVLLAGILGNLGDRLFREPGFAVGKVVDFFQLPFGFPVFNVADICISGAMTVVVVLIMRGKKLLS